MEKISKEEKQMLEKGDYDSFARNRVQKALNSALNATRYFTSYAFIEKEKIEELLVKTKAAVEDMKKLEVSPEKLKSSSMTLEQFQLKYYENKTKNTAQNKSPMKAKTKSKDDDFGRGR